MATDATGTPTSPDSIPTYNTAVDAPSGKGFNAAMAAIQTALSSRVTSPVGIISGETPIWNGSAWVRSSVTGLTPSGIAGYPSSKLKFLAGDGTWNLGGARVLYDTTDAGVSSVAASFTTSSLDQSFAHLLVIWNAKTGAASVDTLNVRMNGDSGATNYAWQDIVGATPTTVSSAGGTAQNAAACGLLTQNNGFDASGFLFLPNYTSTGYVPFNGLSFAETAATPTFQTLAFGGVHKVAGAVTTLTFFPTTGPTFNGLRFTVYGIPG